MLRITGRTFVSWQSASACSWQPSLPASVILVGLPNAVPLVFFAASAARARSEISHRSISLATNATSRDSRSRLDTTMLHFALFGEASAAAS